MSEPRTAKNWAEEYVQNCLEECSSFAEMLSLDEVEEAYIAGFEIGKSYSYDLAKQLEAAKAELEEYKLIQWKVIEANMDKVVSDLAAEKARSAKIIEICRWYIENCEVVRFELVGGDGAPSGYLPYNYDWKQLEKALEEIK